LLTHKSIHCSNYKNNYSNSRAHPFHRPQFFIPLRMAREIFETKRKALKINLNPEIYGTFAEIGAGQEVARNFFNAGAASGTIAKTMSAYDMAFSDAIYGAEQSGRYVSRTRLKKMLNHEFAKEGTEIYILIRNQKVKAVIAKPPFVK